MSGYVNENGQGKKTKVGKQLWEEIGYERGARAQEPGFLGEL